MFCEIPCDFGGHPVPPDCFHFRNAVSTKPCLVDGVDGAICHTSMGRKARLTEAGQTALSEAAMPGIQITLEEK